ncbi:MAG: hypothetical protein JO138_14460 [Acidobacteriaceae bacterium]|nr:hypothetical protein [Acidobacteriaceae bacterium]
MLQRSYQFLISRRPDANWFVRAALLSLFICAITNAQQQPGAASDSSQAVSPTPPAATPVDPPDPAWHANLNSYLWFPGVHGTIGVNGYDVGFRASPSDLLSNFKFGLMGAIGAQRGRFVTITDLVWTRLEADRQAALPLPGRPQITANVKFDQFILSPEVGYRLLDGEKFKIDALGGVRYWHLGSNLQFTPSLAGRNFSSSANWADPVMGARFQAPLGRRVLLTILGDAGGWGAGSQLDYQIVGALGLKLTPKWMLDAGYRYLYVNYVPGSFVYQSAMSGALLGVTYSLK